MTMQRTRFIFAFVVTLIFATIAAADSPDAGVSLQRSDAGLVPQVEYDSGVVATKPALSFLPADRMPKVKLTVEPKTANVGELIKWQVEIKRRVKDRVHLPAEAIFGGLDVQSKNTSVGAPEGDWITEVFEVNLISFEAGEFVIPSQQLSAVDLNGNIAKLETGTASVEIKSLIANEPEPKIKQDSGTGVEVYVKDYTIVYVGAFLLGAVIIALLTLLGRRLWARRTKGQGPPPPPPRPAEEIVLEKLKVLQSSNYLAEGLFKDFHVSLSEAVREYLGNRYLFHSLDRTTQELICDMKKQNLDPDIFERIIRMLEDTDFVKFARAVSSIDESSRMLDDAFEVVRITTPKSLDSDAVDGVDNEKS